MANDRNFAGHILKPHGVHGAVKVNLALDDPETVLNTEILFLLIAKRLIPFFIEEVRLSGNQAIIKFEDVDDLAEAQRLSSCKIYLAQSESPENLVDNDNDKLIGVEVNDQTRGPIGFITQVQNKQGQDLLIVKYQNKEILIPVDSAIIKKINYEKASMIVDLPEGLLELYLTQK